ncbi:LLM class flavin-dependent oxidoreductase [Angustibacter aerolatus]
MTVPLSVLDLAPIAPGETARDSFAASVELARAAERAGFRRVWYAEHHNMPTIASSATSVLIAHVAAHTETIRLGAGGVMLPNHAPLTIAEQYGTLETLHPGRIDLGLGRAPGSDQVTMRAMRRDPMAADTFPQDVLELQGYLRGESRVAGVQATPGAGTDVPLYILGSSLFGAQLAAALGLPYAFASHFAPAALHEAVALYRSQFRPSEQLAEPYVLAAVNVVAADEADDARAQLDAMRRTRVRGMVQRGAGGREYTDAEIDEFLTTPQGRQLADMMRYAVAGTPSDVGRYLDDFAAEARADELIVAFQSLGVADRLHSVALTGAIAAGAAA